MNIKNAIVCILAAAKWNPAFFFFTIVISDLSETLKMFIYRLMKD